MRECNSLIKLLKYVAFAVAGLYALKRIIDCLRSDSRFSTHSVHKMPEIKPNDIHAQLQEAVNPQEMINEDLKLRMPPKPVEMIENTPEMRDRYKRYEEFEKFQESAKRIFQSFRDSDQRAKIYEDYNMLCVTPGGRWGGDKRNSLDIFWGKKIYDTLYKKNNVRHFKHLIEHGVQMSFLRSPKGYVTIYLYPAGTEKDSPYDVNNEILIYKHNINPWYLNQKWYLREIWRDFMAFSEATHLDGKPAIEQRILVGWYRWSKPYFLNEERKSSRLWRGTLWLMKWVFTVGLSGALLIAVDKCGGK